MDKGGANRKSPIGGVFEGLRWRKGDIRANMDVIRQKVDIILLMRPRITPDK